MNVKRDIVTFSSYKHKGIHTFIILFFILVMMTKLIIISGYFG